MRDDTFKALVLNEDGNGVRAEFRDLTEEELPEGNVLVSVAYSSLNYKDGLAVTGKGRVVRSYPMVPGIDLTGTVIESQSSEWNPGDRVVMNGYGAGEIHWGGYTQRARVKSEWLVPLPDGLTLEAAAGIGTAGFTSMLAVMALEEHGLRLDSGEVVVTGAAGGLGSIAVAILAHLGYTVVASTGRTELHEYLRRLGASDVIDREVLAAPSTRPMESARWSGAVDSVGGETLAGILRTLKPWSTVAVCGNAGGNTLATTVLPFILRGVIMAGIDSNYCSQERRRVAWDRLATDLPAEALKDTVRTVRLDDIPSLSVEILQGSIPGRVVIDLS